MGATKQNTGLKVNTNTGSIGVNRSVFYARAEVKAAVTKMYKSGAYPGKKK